MIKQYILQGSVPSKKNSRINTYNGRSFPSKAYTEWHANAGAQLLEQGIVNFTKVELDIQFEFRTNRRTDLDNKLSSILDLLVDMGIIEDDRWQIVGDMRIHAENGNEDMTTITIRGVE